MNESIELKSFSTNYSKASDSEEYHEISLDAIDEEPHASKVTPLGEHDFFIQYENKKIRHKPRKKKGKKKEKVSNLMDVINTEIAAEPFRIKNNIVTFDYTEEVAKYLKVSYNSRTLHARSIDRDPERGYHMKSVANISPIFPCVLENTIIKAVEDVQLQYMEPALFSDIATDYEESSSKKVPKFLDVILRNIKFKHHHDFSLEKLICVKLVEVFEEYEFVKTTLTDLLKNIDINRLTRTNLKEKLLKISSNKIDDARFDSNVLKYTKLMLDFKERYFKMVKREKQLLHKIISLWSDIEIIREKSECKTGYILEVIEVNANNEEFKNEWNNIFEREYSDMIIKIEYEFIIKYKQYKQSKFNNDRQENNKISKPKLKIDYDELRTEIENIVTEILPEDKIEVQLKQNTKKIGSSHDYNKSFYKTNYFKVYVDNVFVCESDVYESKSDQWDVDFEECLSIEILPRNKDLRIVLYENDDDVSTLRVHLSDIKKNTNEINFDKKEFDYNKIVEPTSKTIGSGFDIKRICTENKVRLKSSNMFKGKISTKCEINFKIGWNEKLNNNTSESIKSCADLGIQLKRLKTSKDKANVQVLMDIINDLYERKIDDNENIINKLEHICKGSIKKKESFEFDDINIDITRFKLLHQRHNGGFVDIQNKGIPLFATQISTEQLNSLQQDHKDIDYIKLETNTDMDVIDLQRYIGIKYVENLNKNLIMYINECLLKKTYKDVVKEINILNLRSDEPLHLISNQQALLKQESSKEQEIYITILRAFNLSDRSETLLQEDNDDDENIAGFKVHPLRPFASASYHGVYAQTATAIGCHPTWNHTMKIKTKFEPLSSIHINIYDECKDNASELYSDEHSAQSTVYYRKSSKWLGTVKVPLHTVLTLGNIRGAFKIASPPFTFGYENVKTKESQSMFPEVAQLLKKDTCFIVLQISTSMSRFGGFKNYNQPIPIDPNDSLIHQINEFVTEYINDFPTRNISLTFLDSSGKNKCASEFLQPVPLPEYDFSPTNPKKAESALSKSSGHSRSSSSRSSRKKNSITEESLSGFEAHKGGESLLVKNMEMAIRYVSLIPTYEVTESHVVTLMGMELLKVLYGSPLDHTILLTSFFMHLDIKCWVIIGFGLPRGLSSYVLVKYRNNNLVMAHNEEKRAGLFNRADDIIWYIYDAVAGERFELRDVGCPLKTVSYIFDCENIWVNMQATEDCESVSLDLTKSSNWRAVFDKPLFMTRPIITEGLYSKPADVEKLRSNIEAKIKNKVQKWRSHVKTIWNRYCSSLLKEMLPYYEYWAFNPTEPRPNLGNRLKQLMATYKIFGFPLNMPYLNTKLIISNIKSTAIHVNDDPSVEFGLGVELYSYPNNVISVWVFLVSITRI